MRCVISQKVELNEKVVLKALPFVGDDDPILFSFKWTMNRNKEAGGSDRKLTVDKVSRDHCDGFYTCEVSNKQLCFKVHHCLKNISK